MVSSEWLCLSPFSLQGNGIKKSHCDALRAAGFATAESIAYAPTKNLLAVKGISDKMAEQLKEAGPWSMFVMPF
jgi:hypothetical protein